MAFFTGLHANITGGILQGGISCSLRDLVTGLGGTTQQQVAGA